VPLINYNAPLVLIACNDNNTVSKIRNSGNPRPCLAHSKRAFSLILSHCVFLNNWDIAAHQASTCGAVGLEGCPVFPANNIWNIPVENLPVDALSDSYIESIGADTALHPDFGRPYLEEGQLTPIGIPFVTVSGSQPKVRI
jgi:hypothetical protein